MQDQTVSALEIFETGITKTSIKDMAARSVDHILEVGNPLEAAASLKAMDEFIKGVKEDKRFKNYVIEEMDKYGKDECTTKNGATISPHNGGGRWDYSICNDPILADLEKKVEERKQFLKTVSSKGEDIVDESTGEMVTIFPPNKPVGSGSYAVTLKYN